MAALCVPMMASAVTVWTEGKRTTTASGIPGQAAMNQNKDVAVFDAGSISGGSMIFVGRALGTGFDAWIFDAAKMFTVDVNWFAPSTRKGGPDIGATLNLTRLSPISSIVSSAAMPTASTGQFSAGRYELRITSNRPDAFDYDVSVNIVPLPLGAGLLLAGFGAIGLVGHRRTPRTI